MRAGVYRHWEIAMGSTPPSLQRVSLPLTSASWVARWTSHAVVQICNNPEDVTFDVFLLFFFFSSRRRHTRCSRDWSSDVCSSDLLALRDLRGDVLGHRGLPQMIAPAVPVREVDDQMRLEARDAKRLEGALHARAVMV